MKLIPATEDDLKTFYSSHNGRLKVNYEDLKTILSDWHVFRLMDGYPIAVIVTKSGSAHIASFPGVRVGISRMKWALDQLNVNSTTVSNDFKPGHALAKRLGFFLTI